MKDKPKYILVHADGGECHGTPLNGYNPCPRCGIRPDSQSKELWSQEVFDRNEAEMKLRYPNRKSLEK